MSQIAWLFPGQGSQAVGMGADAADHPVMAQTLAEADEIVGFALSALMQHGPKEALDATINTQPALYAHSVALFRAARAENALPDPAFVAGHSLGEYSALTAAGALPFAAGLRLVRERGRLMEKAGRIAPGGMAAILSLSDAQVVDLCKAASTPEATVQVANYNCPGQIVISGAQDAVERAMALASEAGARRGVPLDVSIAAHSPLMRVVEEEFATCVADAPLTVPAFPVIGNVSGGPLDSVDEIRQELVAQLTGSVQWTATIERMIDAGVDTFYEIGAGAVLTGLVKRINRQTTRYNLSGVDALTP